MDYNKLAMEFFQNIQKLQNLKCNKDLQNKMIGENFILHYIEYKQNNVIPKELCNIMKISSARIAAVLNSLENKELITRKIDLNDRRRIIVELTAKGRKIAFEQQEMIIQNIISTLKYLGENDSTELVRILARLVDFIPTM